MKLAAKVWPTSKVRAAALRRQVVGILRVGKSGGNHAAGVGALVDRLGVNIGARGRRTAGSGGAAASPSRSCRWNWICRRKWLMRGKHRDRAAGPRLHPGTMDCWFRCVLPRKMRALRSGVGHFEHRAAAQFPLHGEVPRLQILRRIVGRLGAGAGDARVLGFRSGERIGHRQQQRIGRRRRERQR